VLRIFVSGEDGRWLNIRLRTCRQKGFLSGTAVVVAKTNTLGRVSLRTSIITNVNTLDRVGIAASCICAAHCALTPLLLVTLPLLGVGFLVEEKTEWAFVLVSVVVGFWSLVPAYVGRHRRCRPLLLFGSGFCLIVIARTLLEEKLHFEMPVVVIGAFLIITSHRINLRLCRSCAVCTDDPVTQQYLSSDGHL
jgi:hypothetical protein